MHPAFFPVSFMQGIQKFYTFMSTNAQVNYINFAKKMPGRLKQDVSFPNEGSHLILIDKSQTALIIIILFALFFYRSR